MAYSELETTWDKSWDKSWEELRQTMIVFAERQDEDLKAEWIALLKKRFGENYDREYMPPPLAKERQKTPELPRTLETSTEGQISTEISKLSLGNFVEHVAGQKQEVSMVISSTENPKMELRDHDSTHLKQNQDHFELEDAQIQNIESELTHGCKFSNTFMERKNLGVRKFSLKRRYHRARKKKSNEYASRRDLVQALKSYSMCGGSCIGDRLVNRNAERVHLKGKRSMVMRRIHRVRKGTMDRTKYEKARKQVSLSFLLSGEIDSGIPPQDSLKPFSSDDLMDSNRLATAARVSEHDYLYFDLDRGKEMEPQMWEIEAILAGEVLLDSLVEFYGFDRILDHAKCLSFGVYTDIKHPTDSKRANHVWEFGRLEFRQVLGNWLEKGEVVEFCAYWRHGYLLNKGMSLTYSYHCDQEFMSRSSDFDFIFEYNWLAKLRQTLIHSTNPVLVIYDTSWDTIGNEDGLLQRSKTGIPELENMCGGLTFEVLAAPLKINYNLSFHLEDKMKFLEGSNSKYGKYGGLVCDIEKKEVMFMEDDDKKDKML